MRLLRLAIPAALLSLVAACGGSSTTSTPPAAPPTSAPTSSSEPSSSAGGQSLTGTLGANDAFTISLVDATGAKVTTLKAGTYQVIIKDTSKIHNLHLSGPGGIDLKTTVPEVTDVTWPVTLTAGTYTFECDPHSSMKETFTVT
jgi:hypothetical protein